jgi:predicted SprT family Zn-dependent metalloprotease
MTKMKSVVYHEIAHAIVREMFDTLDKQILLSSLDPSHLQTKGHGEIWKMVCESIREEDCECQMYYTGMVANDLFLAFRYCCTFCGNKQYGKNKYFATKCSKCKSIIVIENNTI